MEKECNRNAILTFIILNWRLRYIFAFSSQVELKNMKLEQYLAFISILINFQK